MTRKRIVTILCVVAIIGFVIYNNHIQNKLIESEKEMGIKYLDSIPKEYTELLKNPQDTEAVSTINTQFRSPISYFLFRKKYWVELYKIDNSFDISLENFLHESHNDEMIREGEIYYSFPRVRTVHTSYKGGRPEHIKGIYFNLYGDTTKTIMKNDSIASYSSNLKNMFIKLTSDGPQDIYAESKNGGHVPVEVTFFKKHHGLFMMIVTGKDKANPLHKEAFKHIIAQ